MTTPNQHPANVAGEGSHVGVQAGQAYIDTVTIPGGNVQLTVGQDASPEAKFRVGLENLKSGNPRTARKLIWDAMMSGSVNSEMLFHWLVATLSGRTVGQFSRQEIDQLKYSRSRSDAGNDAWADGARLIYRLLDTVLEPDRRSAEADMSLLVKQFENLGEDQREMIRPHLELFLTGHIKDEMWRQELRLAQDGQHDDDRLGRAWMFFQPIPAEVLLPSPSPERISAVDRLKRRASAWLLAALTGYLFWGLLWHGAFLGLLSYAAALAGGAVAAASELECQFLAQRRRQKDERFQIPSRSVLNPSGEELVDGVDKLFKRYFARYAPDKAERTRWEAAAAGHRKFHRDEIIAMCRSSGIPANQVAWLIRYEVRQLKRRWQDQSLYEYRRELLPRLGTVAACWAGLAVLVLGGVWAAVVLWPHLLGGLIVLPSGFWAWWCWRRVSLERRRYAADSQERAQRQQAIGKEFRRWKEKLAVRPDDADMAAWLGRDRTVLLGGALDHFHLPRSRLIAHAFLEEPGVAVKRARIEGGPWRYAGYRLLAFVLAEDGVRQVKANLDFMKGALTERERTSYRYDAIISVRVLREARRGQMFELRLAAGDPITIRVRDSDPGEPQQDENAAPTEEVQASGGEEEEDTAPDETSATDLLHMLEGVAGEGRNWLRKREWAGTWPSDDLAY